MNVGLLSNFWYVRGGLETVMFADQAGLTRRGHRVAGFAAAHPLNGPAEFAWSFPPVTEHGSVGIGMSMGQRGRAAVRLFQNRGAVAAFDRFADAFRPDLVHQHGIARQLS